jgi:hypothetical protein
MIELMKQAQAEADRFVESEWHSIEPNRRPRRA